MTIQFPLGPSVGDTFPYDDYIYTWDGEKWTVLAPGDTYWEKDDNGYLNADTSVIIDGDLSVSGDSTVSGDITVDGDATVGSLNGGQLAGFRNQIINGSFSIWQRGTSGGPIPSGGAYTADHVFIGSNVTWTRAPSAAFAPGLEYGLRFSGNANCYAVFPVELLRTGYPNQFANGTQWTVSYYADRGTDHTVGIYFSDTSEPTNKVDVLAQSTPTSLGGNRYAVTFTVASAPVLTNTCLCARVVNVTGSQIEITGCQLEPGPVATPFEHRPIGTELALCQRYFYKWTYPGRDAVYVMQRDSSNAARSQTLSVPVPMRVLPSSEFYQWEKFSVINNQSNAVTWTSGKGIAGGARGIPFVNFAFYLTIDTLNGVTWGAWTVNYIRSNHNDADNMPYILLDAEL